jgi:hypothetical protein
MNSPVVNGREALSHWPGYPWYDPATDNVRPVALSPGWHSEVNWDFSLSFLGATLQFVAWTVIAASIVVLAYLLVRAFLKRELVAAAADPKATGAADRIDALPLPMPDAGQLDFLAEADRARREGDFGRAIVFLFSYQLLRLDRRGCIRLSRGKTDRQYLREIFAAPLRSLVEQTMLLFEDAFFGHRPPDAAAFDVCWTRLAEFEKLVGVN